MDEETMFALMVDLHKDGERQGPGSADETLRALALTRYDAVAELRVADVGCGTGASTLTIAGHMPNAGITAVDLFPEFLDILAQSASTAGYGDRITPLAASMEALPFEPETFDLIWSEGAVYNMGFERGVREWRPFLRPEGVLAVSEITWLRPHPPAEISEYWKTEYPEIATAPEKIATLDRAGYDLLGYFTLPPSSWIDHYYAPTERRIPAFLERHAEVPEAAEVVALERAEADLYRRYQDWWSYGFYIVRKRV